MTIIARTAAGLVATGLVCGCYKPTGEPWSTKADSSYGASLESTHLDPPVVQTARTPQDRSVQVLLDAAAAPGPAGALLRANAIQGLVWAPEHLEPVVSAGLADDNRGVRFVAAMTVGEQRLEQLGHLLEPMLLDEAPSVRAAAMFGLHECGRRVDLTPLATMIMSDDPEVRGNAAMILGELGNTSAVPMLRHAVGRGMERVQSPRVRMVDLQLAEALVRLGETDEIEVVRASLFAPVEQGELTALACMICGRLDDGKAVPNLVRLAVEVGRFQQPAEVRMAATWALAGISPDLAEPAVPMEYVTSPMYPLRVQAALTLGKIGREASLPTLESMLGDENPLVQVAAATAILQIGNVTVAAGNGL